MGQETKAKNTSWEEKVSDAGAQIEEELRRLVCYINEEVVLQVRRNGSVALRAAAERMEDLARRMDDGERRQTGTPGSRDGGAK